MFKKRTTDVPLIGRLTFQRDGWETDKPPPPIDSAGRLRFEAGDAGPQPSQLDAFQMLIGSYGSLWPAIAEALFHEYDELQKSGWMLMPAGSPTGMAAVTRLAFVTIEQDGSASLSYSLYHEPGRRLEALDHDISLTLRDGRVVDVGLVG